MVNTKSLTCDPAGWQAGGGGAALTVWRGDSLESQGGVRRRWTHQIAFTIRVILRLVNLHTSPFMFVTSSGDLRVKAGRRSGRKRSRKPEKDASSYRINVLYYNLQQ